MADLPFILQRGEKLIRDVQAQYFGVALVSIGVVGGNVSGSNWFGGVSRSKLVKREKSIADAQNCHAYLTNRRIVFVKRTITGKLQGIFNDIHLENIQGIYSSTKFLVMPTVDLAVRSPSGEIDKIAFAFQKIENKVEERDKWVKLIKQYKGSASSEAVEDDETPLKILKLRYAKGEISKKEFEKMKKEFE